MPDVRILAIERRLASSHNSLRLASAVAHECALYGLGDDLWQIADELCRLQEDLLKNAAHLKKSRI